MGYMSVLGICVYELSFPLVHLLPPCSSLLAVFACASSSSRQVCFPFHCRASSWPLVSLFPVPSFFFVSQHFFLPILFHASRNSFFSFAFFFGAAWCLTPARFAAQRLGPMMVFYFISPPPPPLFFSLYGCAVAVFPPFPSQQPYFFPSHPSLKSAFIFRLQEQVSVDPLLIRQRPQFSLVLLLTGVLSLPLLFPYDSICQCRLNVPCMDLFSVTPVSLNLLMLSLNKELLLSLHLYPVGSLFLARWAPCEWSLSLRYIPLAFW